MMIQSKRNWPVVAAATGLPLSIVLYYLKRKMTSVHHRHASTSSTSQKKKDVEDDGIPSLKLSGKVNVDKRFLKQLKYILRICIPSIRSTTTMIIVLHSLFLVLRTYLSVVVARIDGKLVKDLVGANGKEFGKGLIYWFLIAIPATFTNSMIRYFQTKLSLSLRKRLTNHIHDVYLKNKTFYKAVHLDNRIESADQLITTDVKKFCDALSSLYSNLGKPILDLVIFNYQLARSIGLSGMAGLIVNYYITANIMRMITPSFGKLAAEEAKLEGEFRSAHTRIITNAEEIGFYHGAQREESILNTTYMNLIKHVNRILQLKIAYNMFEDFIIKYSWSAVGLLISSIPVFFPQYAGARTKREEAALLENLNSAESQGSLTASEESAIDKKTGSRTQGFITNKRLLISLADAGGRIMYSYKELSELAGYTFRVYNTLRIFDALKDDCFVRSDELVNKTKSLLKSMDLSSSMLSFGQKEEGGIIDYGYQGITFEHVPVLTPFGDTLLVENLSFEMKPGDHLMITGPNGAGKTSILRVLSGLWPLFYGHIRRPKVGLEHIMYIPQRPYLVLGSLRDQIIYPHSAQEMKQAGYTDEDLLEILKLVYLDYIPGREGGFDAIKEWKDIFSGGEKQRIQLARVFYHSPRFVVFDESTSAVSNDVEALLYGAAKEEGITIITISHRPSLFKYHHLLLKLGEGQSGKAWTLERIGNANTLMKSVDAEIKLIQEKLAKSEEFKRRLDEINKELSFQVNSSPQFKDNQQTFIKRTLI